jgi:SPP1 gp7 family putative phage head morphogenesis protein
MCTCVHTNAAKRIDPTRTTGLRNRFEADFNRRFKRIAQAIRREVVTLDGLGLRTNAPRFDFPTNQAKVAAFMSWLGQIQDAEIFGGVNRFPRETAARQIWAASYIQTGYRRGLEEAARKLRQEGAQVSPGYIDAAFLRPVNIERVGIIQTRAYDSLRDITSEMDRQIADTLARGLADGRGSMDIARDLVNRVEKIGRTRARLLARTEIVSASAQAQLSAYQDAGLQGVGLDAEWLTARDDKVCEDCQDAAANGPYTLEQAQGMIPLHPNCRCSWTPIAMSGRDIVLA